MIKLGGSTLQNASGLALQRAFARQYPSSAARTASRRATFCCGPSNSARRLLVPSADSSSPIRKRASSESRATKSPSSGSIAKLIRPTIVAPHWEEPRAVGGQRGTKACALWRFRSPTPERLAEIAWVEPEQVEEAARLIWHSRPVSWKRNRPSHGGIRGL
jgi:hypothetical protein